MYRRFLLIFICLMTFLLLTWQHDHSFRHERPLTLNGKPPLVIGHRGASGYRPEHTLASYELAIELGADVVEPDLVMTKDGVLVCRHEPMLSMTTNVAKISKFAHKRTWRSVAGIKYYDWFASDFTLKEIKELRAIQTRFNRSHAYDGLYQVPTYDEVIALVKAKEVEYNRVIRTYPEIKEPSYHKRLGLPITDTLLKTLEREGWTHKDSPVFIQCFEVATLQYVRSRTNAPIVQLIIGDDVNKYGNIVAEPPNVKPYDFVLSGDPRTYNDLIKNKGLDFIKTYADGIGVWSAFIIPFTFQDKNHDGKPDDLNEDGRIDNRDYFALNPTDLIQRAHKRDLFVHGYTYRNDPSQLLSTYHGDPLKEYRAHYQLGVDGVFSDFADTAIKARNELF